MVVRSQSGKPRPNEEVIKRRLAVRYEAQRRRLEDQLERAKMYRGVAERLALTLMSGVSFHALPKALQESTQQIITEATKTVSARAGSDSPRHDEHFVRRRLKIREEARKIRSQERTMVLIAPHRQGSEIGLPVPGINQEEGQKTKFVYVEI